MGNNVSSPAVDGDNHSALSPSAQLVRELQEHQVSESGAREGNSTHQQSGKESSVAAHRQAADNDPLSLDTSDTIGPSAPPSSATRTEEEGKVTASSTQATASSTITGGIRRPRPASFSTSASSSSLATTTDAAATPAVASSSSSNASRGGDMTSSTHYGPAKRRPNLGRRMLSMLSNTSSSSSSLRSLTSSLSSEAAARPGMSRAASSSATSSSSMVTGDAGAVTRNFAASSSSSPSPLGPSSAATSSSTLREAGDGSSQKKNDKKRRRLSNLLLRRSTTTAGRRFLTTSLDQEQAQQQQQQQLPLTSSSSSRRSSAVGVVVDRGVDAEDMDVDEPEPEVSPASSASASGTAEAVQLAPPIATGLDTPSTAVVAPVSTVEPLTATDPLLDDRLATLTTIRDVLGADVVRSLPAVRRSMESLRRGTETAATAAVEDLPPPLPESTVSLLQDLEIESTRGGGDETRSTPSASATQAQQRDVPDTPSTSSVASPSPATRGPLDDVESAFSPPRPAAAAASSSATSSSQQPQPDRIRNVANRLGGWLGIGYGSSSSSAAASAASAAPSSPTVAAGGDTTTSGGDAANDSVPAAAAMDVDSGSAAQQPTSSNANITQPPASNPAPQTTNLTTTPERIPVGAFMIVQGFVQTTMPLQASPSNQDGAPASGEAADTSSATDDASSSSAASAAQSSHRWGDIDPPADAFEPRRPASESNLPILGEDNDAAASRRRSSLFGQRPTTTSSSTTTDGPQPTFAQQARMLGGLLGLAAAATASQLLAPSDTPSPSSSSAAAGSDSSSPSTARSGRRSTIEALRNRLRPQNLRHAAAAGQTGLSASGFEEAVRDYMRQAMRDDRAGQAVQGSRTADSANGSTSPDDASQGTSETDTPSADPASAFETFLQTMQSDFVRAMSDYAGQDARAGSETEPSSTSASDETATSATSAAQQNTIPTTSGETAPQTESVHAATTVASATPLNGALPSDEAASGATLAELPNANPIAEEASGTGSAATDAATPTDQPSIPPVAPSEHPNSLNFFRMFQFPARPRPAGQINQTEAQQPPLVPVVLIGVRSLPHDPTRDGQDPLAMTPDSNGILPHAQDDASTWPEPPPRPMDPNETRTRWMERLRSWGRSRRARGPASTDRGTNVAEDENIRNYLLWIVGGNYPVGHPILTIPNLITGDLDHDDLWALAQILGQVKPPVATKEDIAKSGLEIVKGNAVQQCLAEGKIRENCAERCLICLEDYAADEDCRIMACKHVFHAECIDRWLEVGRNSCPACRQAGVETQKDPQSPAATAAPTAAPVPPPE